MSNVEKLLNLEEDLRSRMNSRTRKGRYVTKKKIVITGEILIKKTRNYPGM